MPENIGEGRPIRFCPLCSTADDHPRHVVTTEAQQVARHLSCCAAAGCPDGTCNVVLNDAEQLRGAELLAHITKLKPEKVEKALAAHRKANPHQDPAHPAFGGFDTPTTNAISLQGADR